MSSWHEKSKGTDLYFCTNLECNVITFKPSSIVRPNSCPKCFVLGAIVRSSSVLLKGIPDKSPKVTESQKPA